MPDFPHLKDTQFPHVGNIDVYKYENEFDYSRYDTEQMRLTLCDVPWDMGEAHIGSRTISGIGNVVYFGTEAARDAWFASIPDSKCLRFTTKSKELHRDNQIMLPVPFDVACRYNYLVAEYEPFANRDSLVQYERLNGLDKWFWFVREVEFVSPNTTRLYLLNDAWQTWIYRINITGMMLERGHAPLFAITADDYLANPRANNAGLLSEDVNYGDIPSIVADTEAHVFNEETRACFVTTANPLGTWGTKAGNDWQVPTSNFYQVNGAPGYEVFSMDAADISTFISNMEADYPQFAQTVKGVFFAPEELLSYGNTFTFCGVQCKHVYTINRTIEFRDILKAQFGYPTRYADLAKLYTYPYSCIEISDENGNSQIVKVEDTNGALDICACLNLAYPAITIQAHILGIGGSNSTVSFAHITSRNFKIGGKWYETLHSWDVPIFGIIQSPSKHNDYATHYDRVQKRVALENAYDSALATNATVKDNADDAADATRNNAYRAANTTKANADDAADATKNNAYRSATTNKDNADDMADAAKNNAYRSADLMRDNAALTTAANDEIHKNAGAGGSGNGTNIAAIYANAAAHVTANNAQVTQANNFIDHTTNAQIDATLQSAAVSMGAGIATSAASAITSAATGNIAGAVGTAIGGIINAGAAGAQANISANLTATQAYESKEQNKQRRISSNNLTDALALNAASAESSSNTTNNNLLAGTGHDGQGGISGNTASCNEQNADESSNVVKGGSGYTGTAPRTQATEKDNADESQHVVKGGGGYTGTAPRTQAMEKDNADESRNVVKGGGSYTGTAPRTKATNDANAARTKDTAENEITNGIAQAGIASPFEFGAFENCAQVNARPQMLIANVLTQSKSAVQRAGDEFLRYGYYYGMFWDFDGNWNIGENYTYWKLTDFWVEGLEVPDMYVDKIRFFLFGGVTVWRQPEDIGNKTIYENWSA